ncbi:SRPBCC family protein [Pedobacter sandarakinus]|uniref:SRPBCC family protein n=1 Tax=Pedobacter sandarakinus TaxID=353156 RepID=UPI0022483C69|nr:SRPBCC family protein [Pedobacter sandarakinus]MCX2576023.1 SRPBCC family protein [Pedobacter sandarakinus]
MNTFETEIVTRRLINAPRELVYEAWTNPNHLKNWWGPKGFTNTFEQFDLKVGGRWRFVMHGPDKGNYQNECEFTEITPPELLAWQRISKPIFQVVAIFEEVGLNKTNLIFKMVFDSPEECNKLKTFVVDKNEENLDKLEDELKKMS